MINHTLLHFSKMSTFLFFSQSSQSPINSAIASALFSQVQSHKLGIEEVVKVTDIGAKPVWSSPLHLTGRQQSPPGGSLGA